MIHIRPWECGWFCLWSTQLSPSEQRGMQLLLEGMGAMAATRGVAVSVGWGRYIHIFVRELSQEEALLLLAPAEVVMLKNERGRHVQIQRQSV